LRVAGGQKCPAVVTVCQRQNKLVSFIFVIVEISNLEFIHPRCAIENLCEERLYRHRCWSGRIC